MAQNGAYRTIGGKRYILKPRDYPVTILRAGTAGGVATGVIAIDPSAPFLYKGNFIYDTADPSTTAPGLVGQYESFISVQDNANNYSWMTIPEPRSTFARDRTHGYLLTDECLIMANTRLVITVVDPLVGNAAGSQTVTLKGFALYPDTGL